MENRDINRFLVYFICIFGGRPCSIFFEQGLVFRSGRRIYSYFISVYLTITKMRVRGAGGANLGFS